MLSDSIRGEVRAKNTQCEHHFQNVAPPSWTIPLPNLLKVFAVLAQPRRCATPRASGQGIVAFEGAKPGLALRPARPAPGFAIPEAGTPARRLSAPGTATRGAGQPGGPGPCAHPHHGAGGGGRASPAGGR